MEFTKIKASERLNRLFDLTNQSSFAEFFDRISVELSDEYLPKVKPIEYLREQIAHMKSYLVFIHKLEYSLHEKILPAFLCESSADRGRQEIAALLNATYFRLITAVTTCIQFLEDDLQSKVIDLDKRREKRRRYRSNKKEKKYSDFCNGFF